MILNFNDINSAQLTLMKKVSEEGFKVSTRGFNTLEITPIYFTITNPRNRITTLKKRNWNFAAAVGELAWHLSGSKQVDFISKYLKQWSNF